MYNGQTPSRNVKEYWKGDIPWLTSGELNHGIVKETVEKISESGKRVANLRLVPSGTIVIAITGLEAPGTRGNCAILGTDTTINQSVMALFVKDNIDTQFIFQWYKKIGQEYGIKYTQGTKQQSYNYDIVKILPIGIPTATEEQKKIGKLLNCFSALIALYERKLQLNLKLYAELLNQFIPDKNSKSILNKINWQSISLGKIAHLQKGKQKNRNDISEVRNDKETYPVYNGGKEKSGYTDEYNRNDSIIISEGGNSAGYVNYIAGKFYSGGHNYSIEPQNIDSSLLYLILLRNQSRIMNLRTGSGLPNIKISSLKSFKIFIPSKNDNLYDFDKLLILFTKDNNLIKDKLNKLKLIKKTLLNTMFI